MPSVAAPPLILSGCFELPSDPGVLILLNCLDSQRNQLRFAKDRYSLRSAQESEERRNRSEHRKAVKAGWHAF